MEKRRLLSDKEYERMTNYETGKWYQSYPSLISEEDNHIKELKDMGYTVKVYNMTTTVRGYYKTVILVKK